MADARSAALRARLRLAAVPVAAALAMALAPALAQERRAPPGPPTSLLPAAPAPAAPARPEPAVPALAPSSAPAPAPAPAPARDVGRPERAASRHPVSPVLYLPPGPGRPGLTARVEEPRR